MSVNKYGLLDAPPTPTLKLGAGSPLSGGYVSARDYIKSYYAVRAYDGANLLGILGYTDSIAQAQQAQRIFDKETGYQDRYSTLVERRFHDDAVLEDAANAHNSMVAQIEDLERYAENPSHDDLLGKYRKELSKYVGTAGLADRSGNPSMSSDHYRAGWKDGAKDRERGKFRGWSTDAIRDSIKYGKASSYSNALKRAGADYHEAGSGENEYIEGYLDGHFAQRHLFGAVPWRGDAQYRKDQAVFLDESKTKVRRYIDSHPDENLVPYFDELVSQNENPYPGSGCPHTHFTELSEELGKPLAAWIERRKHGPGWPRHCEKNPRFVPESLMPELANLWHLSRVHSNSRYERLIWTSREFHKLHPELSETAIYKDLDAWDMEASRALGGRSYGRRRRNPDDWWKASDYARHKYAVHRPSGLFVGSATSEDEAIRLVDRVRSMGEDPVIYYIPRGAEKVRVSLASLYQTPRSYNPFDSYQDMIDAIGEWLWPKGKSSGLDQSNVRQRMVTVTNRLLDSKFYADGYDGFDMVQQLKKVLGGREEILVGRRFFIYRAAPNKVVVAKQEEAGNPTGGPYEAVGQPRMQKGYWGVLDTRDGHLVRSGLTSRKAAQEVADQMNEEYLSRGEYSPVTRTYKASNPSDAAAVLYESFHGAPSEEVLELHDTINYHSNLTVLGDLREIKVRLGDKPTGKGVIIHFSDSDDVKLCSNEEGTQLYIEGGDQSLDLSKMNLTEDEMSKESVIIGPIQELTYRTRKQFHKFRLTDYYHRLGEETGHEPVLIYDRLNSKLLVSGGAYKIKPEGIVN